MTAETNWCTLKVNNDGMYALMCLAVPQAEEELYVTESMVMDFLAENGVVYGINAIAIESMIENVMYGQYLCVARGKEATRGNDGYYRYEKEMRDMKKKPLISEDGTADYKNSLSLATISEGELLATYVDPTEGEDGTDVFGNLIKNRGRGKDLLPLKGRGIRSDAGKRHYYADYSGHIVMDGNKLHIDKLYIVNGDLDIETGNIVFDADVEIRGDVRSGLSVNTKGSIFVHGHVGACKLYAGQNIVIEKGVQGHDVCVISAAGDVACKFVERCNIVAGGNIYADSVLNSVLTAKRQIICSSKTGNVVGGEVYGMTGIIIKEAGNDAGTPTLLRAGLPREEYQKAADLAAGLKETETKIESFNHHLEALEGADSSRTDIADIRMKIMRAKIVLNTQKKEYEEELAIISERIKEDAENSFINIQGIAFEGVRIYIGAYPYIVTESVKEVSYKVHRGMVVCEALESED